MKGRIALLIAAAALAAAGVSAFAQEKKSVKAGVYTAAQAERGQALYKTKCASCHAANYFTDNEFYTNYAGKPLWDLFDVISDSMPMDDPGSLKKEQYADLIAYVLQLNRFPTGDADLPIVKDALSRIQMEKP